MPMKNPPRPGLVVLQECIDGVVGLIAVGKAADMVVLNGDPAREIRSIEWVDTVFKDGAGYDPAKPIKSVRGLVGLR
jgi:hypothetical protein